MGWWCGVVVKGRAGPGIFQVDMSCMSSAEIFPRFFPSSSNKRASLLAQGSLSRSGDGWSCAALQQRKSAW